MRRAFRMHRTVPRERLLPIMWAGGGSMEEQSEMVVNAPKGAMLQYGGQAVIEGVMMRSPRYFAVACRKPDGAIIVQREEVDKSILGKLKWLNHPFLRGTLALIDAMALGSRALAFASQVQIEAEQASLGRSENGSAPSPETHLR